MNRTIDAIIRESNQEWTPLARTILSFFFLFFLVHSAGYLRFGTPLLDDQFSTVRQVDRSFTDTKKQSARSINYRAVQATDSKLIYLDQFSSQRSCSPFYGQQICWEIFICHFLSLYRAKKKRERKKKKRNETKRNERQLTRRYQVKCIKRTNNCRFSHKSFLTANSGIFYLC